MSQDKTSKKPLERRGQWWVAPQARINELIEALKMEMAKDDSPDGRGSIIMQPYKEDGQDVVCGVYLERKYALVVFDVICKKKQDFESSTTPTT